MIKDFTSTTKVSLLVLALLAGISGCGKKSPEEHIAAAKQYLQKNDHKTAIIELKSAVQEQPGNGEARLLLGESLYASRDYPAAEKEFKKARESGVPADRLLPLYSRLLIDMGQYQRLIDEITPSPTLSPASAAAIQAYRANAYLSLNKKEQAIQAVALGAKSDPQHPEILLTRARIALNDKQLGQANELLDAAIQRDHRFADALYLKAALLDSEGKETEALRIYQQIIANDPTAFSAHLALADHYMREQKLDAAEKAIREAKKAAPNVPIVNYARALLELRRGNLKAANDSIQQVLRVEPDHLPSQLIFAVVTNGLGNYEQGRQYAERVYAKAPNFPPAAKVLAASQIKTGDTKAALALITPMLAKYPKDPQLLALAGQAYLIERDYAKATLYLDQAATLTPADPVIKTRLAAGYMGMGDSDRAMAQLEDAAGLATRPGRADMALIVLHLRRREYDDALKAVNALEKELPSNPVTHNLRAAALLGKNDRAGARKSLEQALSIQPTYYPAAANLARLDMQDKKPDSARKRFESILQGDKNNIQAMMAMADLAASQKQEKDYLGWLEKAAKSDAKAIPPRTKLVQYHLANKDYDKALSLAKEAVNANPDNPVAFILLGTTQMATDEKGNAQATFSQLVKKEPQSSDALVLLAMGQIAANENAKARATLNKALQIRPDSMRALDALIRLEMLEHKPDNALRFAKQMQDKQPKSAIGFSREAEIHVSQKRYSQAVTAYEQALAHGAGSAGLIRLHGALYLAGNAPGAEKQLVHWLKQHPADASVRAYAAEFYAVNNRNREAIAQYEQLLQLTPENALALNNLANLYQAENDQRALTTAERALKLDPENPLIQDTLGWVLVEQGQASRGIDLLRKALSKNPKNMTFRYHRAVALFKLGDKAEARKELERLLSTDQKFPEVQQAKALLKSL